MRVDGILLAETRGAARIRIALEVAELPCIVKGTVKTAVEKY